MTVKIDLRRRQVAQVQNQRLGGRPQNRQYARFAT